MSDYEVNILETSRELSIREKIRVKDTSAATGIDSELQSIESSGGKYLSVELDFCAKLSVHNEKSDNKDYSMYIFVDRNGNAFGTSSESAYKAVQQILEEANPQEWPEEEPFTIGFYRQQSKNFNGKFILATLL